MKPFAPSLAPTRHRLSHLGPLDSRANGKAAAAIALAVLAAGLSTAVAREWTPVRSPTSQDLTSVHFSNSHDGFAAGAFGALLKTSDGGRTWTSLPTPVNHSFLSVWSAAPGDALVGRLGLYRTRDCGVNWDSDIGGYAASTNSIFDILFTTPDTGFFIKGGDVLRTVDGGSQWMQVGGSGQFLDDLHYAGGQTIYATGGITFIDPFGSVSRGEMERSRDGGATWAPVELPGINDVYAAAWQSETSGFLFTFTNKAHHTSDAGDSWTLVSDSMTDSEGQPLPGLITDALIDTDGRIIAVDFNGNFLESENGAEWTVVPGSRDPLSALTRLPDGTLIAVGNSGGIWRSAPPAPRPPALVQIAVSSGAQGELVTIDATGTAGRNYRLMSSSDLLVWSEEDALFADLDKFSFVVNRPPNEPTRLFRVEEVQPRK